MDYNIDELIAKKIKEDISPEELSYLEEWRSSNPDHEFVYKKIVEYWESKYFFNESKRIVWEGLEEELRKDKGLNQAESSKPLPQVRVRQSFFWEAWKVAAAIALFTMGYWAFDSKLKQSEEGPEKVEVIAEMLEKATPLGTKLNLRLADSTRVKLNAGSSLRYPKYFHGDKREVFLTGEAFFDVAHDTSRPFIIHTQQIETRVLGTSFNIKTDEDAVQVVVVTGKVAVTNTESQEQVILPPDQMVNYNSKTQSLKAEKADPDLLVWKDDVILFEKASMETIEKKLRHWYGVEFIHERNVVLPGGFTARFKKQSLENILESISYAGKFKFKIEEEKVTIY